MLICLSLLSAAQAQTGGDDSSLSGASKNANPVCSPTAPDGPRLPSLIPPEYRLDSGDRVQIDLMTSAEQSVVQRLDHNGNVSLYPAGEIRLRGLTSEQARRKIEKAMRVYFHKPVVSVRLVQLRTFYVTVSGTVAKPGRYLVDGLTGVCDLIQDRRGTRSPESHS